MVFGIHLVVTFDQWLLLAIRLLTVVENVVVRYVNETLPLKEDRVERISATGACISPNFSSMHVHNLQ